MHVFVCVVANHCEMSIQAIFNIHLGSASIKGKKCFLASDMAHMSYVCMYLLQCACFRCVQCSVCVCVRTPAGYTVLFESYLFVADSGNSYVQMLTTAGIFQRYIGKGVVSSLYLSLSLSLALSLSLSLLLSLSLSLSPCDNRWSRTNIYTHMCSHTMAAV